MGTTTIITSLKPGKYTVTITDKNKCTADKSFVITEPNKLDIGKKSHIDNECYGDQKGELSVSVSGGTSLYSYNWSNGATSSSISKLSAGTYSLTVTDKNKCTSTATYKITEPSELTIGLVSQKNNDCFGDQNGSLEVVGKGGTPDYNYNWSTGDKTSSISGLKAGNYDITVTDKNGCTAETSYKITENDQLEIDLIQIQQNSCFGESKASIEVKGSGGVGPYTYEWSTGSKKAKIDQLMAGTYEITVRDIHNCEDKQSFTIKDPDELQTELLLIEDALCFAEKSGLIGVRALGGIAPYSYQWSNGQTTGQINDLSAGKYTVTIMDKNGCEDETSYEIDEPAQLEVELKLIEHNTCGAKQSGSIEISVNGGTGSYQYLWSNGAKTSKINDLSSGTYTVEVTDENQCMASAEFVLETTENLLPSKENIKKITCHGDENGGISLEMKGGKSPYTYNWSNGDTNSGISQLKAGRYTVVVMDSEGCTFEGEYLIFEPDALRVDSLEVEDVLCGGDTSGRVEIFIQGGTGNTEVEWTYRPKDEKISQIVKINTHSINDSLIHLSGGIVGVKITDDNQCVHQDSFEVKEPEAIKIDHINLAPIACHGDQNGQIMAGFKGGSGIDFIEWTYQPNPTVQPRQIKVTYNELTDTLSQLDAGTYFVQVADTNGCTYTDSFQLDQPDQIEFEYSTVDDLPCHGDSTGRISIGMVGGVGPYNVEWTYRKNAGDSPRSIEWTYNVEADTLQATRAGLLSALVTDRYNCQQIKDFVVREPDPITLIEEDLMDASCFGEKDGLIEVEFDGGTNINFVEWTYQPITGGGFRQIKVTYNQKADKIDTAAAGTYRLLVRDENKCESASEVKLGQPTLIEYTVVDIKSSSGRSGSIEMEVSGGSGSYLFDWSGPKGFVSNDEDIDQLEPGEYICEIEDTHGCLIQTDTLVVPLSTGTFIQSEMRVSCFPQPFIDQVEVKFDDVDKTRHGVLYSSSGQKVKVFDLSRPRNTLNLKNLQGNQFILMIRCSVGSKPIKLVR